MASYTMSGNLDSCPGTGLIIGADNITLDCNGSTITGNLNGYGINSTGFDNSTIENCIIQNFPRGIYFENSNNDMVLNNTITNTRGATGSSPGQAGMDVYGIYLSDSAHM